MPKLYRVELTSEERSILTDMVNRRSPTALPVRRALMLLKADEAEGRPAWSDAKIAESYEVSIRTVERLRERFVEEGFEEALHGKKREPTKEKIFDGAVEAHLIALRDRLALFGTARRLRAVVTSPSAGRDDRTGLRGDYLP